MKVLITGKNGQLGWELEQLVPSYIQLVSLSSFDLDISNANAVNSVLTKHSPDIVINTAAYTAVDMAETDQQMAYAVNESGCENLALTCKKINAKMIHISTDFVFDGAKSTPYQTSDKTNPINIYGSSKLAGEIKVNDVLGEQATIIRTAWVYSVHGKNFVKTMLRLMAEKEELSIVYDQVGTPTWAKGLAKMIWSLVNQSIKKNNNLTESNLKLNNQELYKQSQIVKPISSKILHWTDAGVCSWYDFAVAIQDLALEKKILNKVIPIRPIPASAYPTSAKRPSFSIIDKSSAEQASGLETLHWRKQLSAMMDELNEQ